MENVTWHFPETLNEAIALAQASETKLHAGGTHVSGKRLKAGEQLVALDQLSLKGISFEDDTIRIGSMATYTAVARKLEHRRPGHLLAKALGQAASLPLRNRITVGGSLRLAANWSDLTGPLLALNAQVAIAGKKTGTFPVAEYLTDSTLRKDTLILEIILPDAPGESWYYREVTTKTDYPAFTISICVSRQGSLIQDIAITLTGHTKRFMRFTETENHLKNREVSQVDIPAATGRPDIRFSNAPKGSGDYLKHVALVQLERGLHELLKA